jgi:hypothetical protein
MGLNIETVFPGREPASEGIGEENMTQNQNVSALRQILVERITQHSNEVTKFQRMLGDFDREFGGTNISAANGATQQTQQNQAAQIPKRRGPKPGFKRQIKAGAARPGPKPAATRGKPGPKPRKQLQASPKKRTNAAAGRREVLENKRPKLKDAITRILKDSTMNASMIYEKLHAKGWLPNSNEPRVYIAQFLSANKDVFERVPAKGRGFYRAAAVKANPTTTKTETVAHPAAPSVSDTDATLAEAGIIASAN